MKKRLRVTKEEIAEAKRKYEDLKIEFGEDNFHTQKAKKKWEVLKNWAWG